MRRTVITGQCGGRERTIVMEEFRTFDELLKTNESREYNYWGDYKGKDYKASFNGVNTYEEAVNMLRYGYAPDVKSQRDRLDKSVKTMNAVKTRPKNDIVGYLPHVPNAIIGVPQSMINNERTYRRSKVVKMIVDIGVLGGRTKEEVDEWGLQLLEKIVSLEMNGYRVRLEYLKTISGRGYNEMYLVKVLLKNENNAFDIKRMSFPISHVSMQRVIAWDWYERLPEAMYISGFGQSLSCGDEDALERRRFIQEKICDKDTIFLCIFDDIEEKLKGVK